MSHAREPLIREYRELLRKHGVEHLLRPPLSAEDYNKLLSRIREKTERSAAVYGAENLIAVLVRRYGISGETLAAPRDHYAETAHRIEEAVRVLGFNLPGAVYVGEYPHHSFNAQACAMKSGTLLLINTGLWWLLYDVSLALGTRIVTFKYDENGNFQIKKPTTAMLDRTRNANTNLANSLAAYILYTDPTRGGKQEIDGTARGFLSRRIAGAAETFAIAHEYGHFLAGHLDNPRKRSTRDEWLRKSHAQEFEADEIGMMLAMKAEENTSLAHLSYWKQIVVAGVFLFFGIDHLLNRVRNAVTEISQEIIVSDHPPSDARAAALRQMLTELEEPDVFQLADSYILPALSENEDRILDSVRRLLRRS